MAMQWLLNNLGTIIIWAIVGLGIYEFYKYLKIKDLINPKVKKNVIREDIDYTLEKNLGQTDTDRQKLKSAYYSFLEIISIFPLLGMLGTVVSLLAFSGELEAGNLEVVQHNFFGALGTTCAGLVAAIIFKGLNSGLSAQVEERQAELDRVIHNLDCEIERAKRAEVEDEG